MTDPMELTPFEWTMLADGQGRSITFPIHLTFSGEFDPSALRPAVLSAVRRHSLLCANVAFVGSVLALLVTGQMLSIAAKIGFISLCGIASRNGILLMNHYLHLVKHEGETWSKEMIVRAGKERLAPVLMTALTSGTVSYTHLTLPTILLV